MTSRIGANAGEAPEDEVVQRHPEEQREHDAQAEYHEEATALVAVTASWISVKSWSTNSAPTLRPRRVAHREDAADVGAPRPDPLVEQEPLRRDLLEVALVVHEPVGEGRRVHHHHVGPVVPGVRGRGRSTSRQCRSSRCFFLTTSAELVARLVLHPSQEVIHVLGELQVPEQRAVGVSPGAHDPQREGGAAELLTGGDVPRALGQREREPLDDVPVLVGRVDAQEAGAVGRDEVPVRDVAAGLSRAKIGSPRAGGHAVARTNALRRSSFAASASAVAASFSVSACS